MSEEKDLQECLSDIPFHLSDNKVIMCVRVCSFEEIETYFKDRFEIARKRASFASAQIDKIRDLANENGYTDIITLLDEKKKIK